jgi:hypothetical protein
MNKIQHDHNISLVDVINFLVGSGRNIFIGVVLGVLFGVAFDKIYIGKYYVEARLKPIQINGSSSIDLSALLDNMKNTFFYSEFTNKSCELGEGEYIKIMVIEKLSPTINKDSGEIKISNIGKNKNQVQECIQSAIQDVNSYAKKIAQKDQIIINKIILLEKQELEKLERIFEVKNINPNSLLYQEYISIQKNHNANKLKMEEYKNIIANNIYLEEYVYQPNEMVRLKKGAIIALSALMGFVLSLALSLGRKNLRIKM